MEPSIRITLETETKIEEREREEKEEEEEGNFLALTQDWYSEQVKWSKSLRLKRHNRMSKPTEM